MITRLKLRWLVRLLPDSRVYVAAHRILTLMCDMLLLIVRFRSRLPCWWVTIGIIRRHIICILGWCWCLLLISRKFVLVLRWRTHLRARSLLELLLLGLWSLVLLTLELWLSMF